MSPPSDEPFHHSGPMIASGMPVMKSITSEVSVMIPATHSQLLT